MGLQSDDTIQGGYLNVGDIPLCASWQFLSLTMPVSFVNSSHEGLAMHVTVPAIPIGQT